MENTEIDKDNLLIFYRFLEQDETELRAIKKEEVKETTHVSNFEDFSKFCERWDGKANISAGIHERKKGGTKKEDVIKLRIIPIDIDSNREKDQPATHQELKETERCMRNILIDFDNEGFNMPAVAMSGNGYHVLFKIPAIDLNDENRDNTEEKLKEFTTHKFKFYEDCFDVKIDQISDLARILRVPGTMNIKGEATSERAHRRSRIIQITQEEDEKLKNVFLKTEIKEKENIELVGFDPKRDLSKKETLKKFEKFCKKDKKLKELFEGEQTQEYKTRSEAEQALTNKLVFYNFTDGEIAFIMRECKIGKWQEKIRKRQDQYCKLTTEKARNNVKERYSEEVSFFDKGGSLKRKVLADHILENFIFKTLEDTEEILFFDEKEGIYKNAETVVKSYITKIAEKSKDIVTTNSINEILNYIRRNTYTKRENFNQKNKIVLKNKILHLNPEFKVEDHTPDHLATFRIPVNYDPEADCPKIKKFISEVVDEEDIKRMQEVVGYCLFPNYPFHQAVMLLGNGKNGKSTFLRLIKQFLGRENVSSQDLHSLCETRFASADLYGKLANIHPDISSKKLFLTGIFKALVGQDLITAEKKFKNTFKFTNHAKLLFSTNQLPVTKDISYAFFRRWIIIEFSNTFEGDKCDPNLLGKLSTEEELSGLLNWAIEGLKRILKQSEFSKQKTEKVKWKWISQTDSLLAFVKKYVMRDGESFILKDDFFEEYKNFCDEFDLPVIDKSLVGRKLPLLIQGLETARPEMKGTRKRVWKGIRFIEEIDDEYNKDAQEEKEPTITKYS